MRKPEKAFRSDDFYIGDAQRQVNEVTTKRKEKTMKKVLLTVGCGIGVIVGAILIWKSVLPFIGSIFQHIWGFLAALF